MVLLMDTYPGNSKSEQLFRRKQSKKRIKQKKSRRTSFSVGGAYGSKHDPKKNAPKASKKKKTSSRR